MPFWIYVTVGLFFNESLDVSSHWMNMYWIAKSLLVLAVLTPHSLAKRDFEVRQRNITCINYSHIITGYNCSIGTIKRNKLTHTSVNVYFSLTENYNPNNVQVITNLQINGEWKNLHNFTMDACELFKKSVNMPLIKIFSNQFKDSRKSNLISCPLYKNTVYYVRNLYVDPEWLPPYTPTMTTDIYINILQQSEILATVNVFSVIRKRSNH